LGIKQKQAETIAGAIRTQNEVLERLALGASSAIAHRKALKAARSQVQKAAIEASEILDAEDCAIPPAHIADWERLALDAEGFAVYIRQRVGDLPMATAGVPVGDGRLIEMA